jgi:hypothetical protein
VDLLCVAAAVLVFAVVFFYLVLVVQEGSRPTLWAVALLTLSGAGAVYASRRVAWGRRSVAGLSGTVMIFLGYLTLFSIGIPLVLAATLCIVAALKPVPRSWQDTV